MSWVSVTALWYGPGGWSGTVCCQWLHDVYQGAVAMMVVLVVHCIACMACALDCVACLHLLHRVFYYPVTLLRLVSCGSTGDLHS